MSSSSWMPRMRRVVLLGAAAMVAAASANAQSTFAANESSSSAYQLVADDGFGGGAALPAAPSAGGSGAAAGQQEQGWKHAVSSNFAFEAGGGFNAPVGNDTPFLTWGGNFTVGAGLHFSKRVSLLAEYQFMDDKLPGALIADAGSQGGHAHIWSLTLDPVIDLLPKHANSVYFTGGGGFYRKVTSFTDPEEVEECYYFCEVGTENVVVGHFSSNQGGVNLGMGFSHRLGSLYGDGKAKLFAEARYVFLNTPGITETNGLGTTEVLPVTVGVRW